MPMTVLRRLDCVLEPTKEKVLAKYQSLKATQVKNPEPVLNRVAGQTFHNTSKFTFQKLIGDPDNIAKNLMNYIKGFSSKAREVFEYYSFEQEIAKLEESNRLFLIVKEFAAIDFHPNRVTNTEMGSIFEELVRRFNEQANEEAGDHFTPREVIRLMVHLLYDTEDQIFTTKGLIRTLYDPTCGSGGMLSVSEEYLADHAPGVHLELFGQEYNPESYAICRSDMLIKGEDPDHIVFGDTLGDGKTSDGFPHKRFHYLLANPPFGVEWKPEHEVVTKEHNELGFQGRFGPGLPRINDGSFLFLLHMMSKMHPSPDEGGDGSRIGIVFNGSPLFTGDAGSGESNIRKWIIEHDYLEAVVALPDQLFYNTGIFTYIWIVSNRKPPTRKGKIQLINAIHFYQKMRKSLGNKRQELSEEQIADITRIYGAFQHNDTRKVKIDGNEEEVIVSKIFDNREFGFAKMVVERPLRLNIAASSDRIERLYDQSAFASLAASKKRKDSKAKETEEQQGREEQQAIILALKTLDPNEVYKNREEFLEDLDEGLKEASLKLKAPIKKAILSALSERDETADICLDKDGNLEPDPELRDTENVPLPLTISLPIEDKDLPKLVQSCEAYLTKEVKPHVPDAWIDHSKTKMGYEIPLTRHFYTYHPPRPLEDIERDIKTIEKDILKMLAEVTG